ncbi:hypothetical protein [Aquisphaera giovannonii]|uniref:hypothetical protein n=1 Tax=Aquisphaera giovannonii TaxID=406548 RepID=UPI0011DF6B49|nr:hypothetical protein [Aquisphaera giovannonii]
MLSALSTKPTATVSGTDTKGDHWTLTLYGPGTMNVVDTAGIAFTKANRNQARDIGAITVSGTVTSQSRLIGKVTPGANSDGRVFFQQMNIEATGAFSRLDPTRPLSLTDPTAQNGIAAVNMPDFWLGNTSGTKPTQSSPLHAGFFVAGSITATEGINVLRFGGVDATYTPTGGTPLNTTSQNNEFVVSIGTPVAGGVSVIVKKSITDAQTVAPTGTNTTGQVFQQSATFLATGRLNLFQANEIDGNTTPSTATLPAASPSQFLLNPPAPTPTTTEAGGTYVVSQGGAVTGQIGNIKVLGNATNFTTFTIENDVFSTQQEGVLDPRITNFYIGGETNNVAVVAPGGTRNVSFGRGMDNVKINTQFIQYLKVNRGAVNSSVTSSRQIGNMIFGGDVINSLIQSGYSQTLATYANTPSSGFTSGGGVFNGVRPPDISDRQQNSLTGVFAPTAHGGGAIKGRIAGNVIDSVISTSVDPDPSGINEPGTFSPATTKFFPFGTPQNIVLPRGTIDVKVEGVVDNSGVQSGGNPLVSPDVPADTAFFAAHVKVKHGPVVPPNVDQLSKSEPIRFGHSQRWLKGLIRRDNSINFPGRKA